MTENVVATKLIQNSLFVRRVVPSIQMFRIHRQLVPVERYGLIKIAIHITSTRHS